MTLTLTPDELRALTGYRRGADQLRELHRQGYWRARRSPTSGAVILERAHAEAVQRAEHGVLAHGPTLPDHGGEHERVRPATGERMQFAQDLDGLPSQRDKVRPAVDLAVQRALHVRSGDGPHCRVEVHAGLVTGYQRMQVTVPCESVAERLGITADEARAAEQQRRYSCWEATGNGRYAVAPMVTLSAALPTVGGVTPRLTYVPPLRIGSLGASRSHVLHLSIEGKF